MPKKFGRYELLELLATGGMAYIFRARLCSAQGTEKELVIKQVLPHLAQNREFIEMFIDEARISMPLNHGNIIQVFEFGQVEQDYFLAMEYLRGRNLESVITRIKECEQAIPIPIALFIASEVAKGLDYAHRFRDPLDRHTGIIHRDVSPQNILIGFQGEVKLTDFGIAKASSRIRHTSQGIIRGKACYLSPEQAECLELDGRSDQFSLATVLFEMLTGIRPFEGNTEVATLDNVRRALVEPPSRLRPEIPPALDEAICKAMSGNRQDRFETASAFQVILAQILYQLVSDFHSASLADWMRSLFAKDISQEISLQNTKERLLKRMGQENAPPNGIKLSTGEILKMGTVPIHAPVHSFQRFFLWLLGILVVAFVGAGIGLWSNWTDLHCTSLSQDLDGWDDLESSHPEDGQNKPDGSPLGDGDKLPLVIETSSGKDSPNSSLDSRQTPPVSYYGSLDVNSRPWAFVDIDGKRQKKETPLFGIRVRAGKHRLRFFNPELKIEKEIEVLVRANQTETVTVKLLEP